MRAVVLAAAALLGGCQLLLGIDDPTGDECSPFDVTTCDLTDTCDLDPDDGQLTCRPEGTVRAGGLCFEVDDCAGPLSCSDGVCRTFCPVFGQPCEDPEGECLRDWGSGNVCDSACDVIADTGCLIGTECRISTNGNGQPIALCVPENYYGAVAEGDGCSFLSECLPRLSCHATANVCTALCLVGEQCANGPCEQVFDTLHGQLVGQCPP